MKKRFSKSEDDAHSPKLTGEEKKGLLVALFGASADIEDESGISHRCHLRKNLGPLVVGDHVLFHPEKNGTGTVIDYLPRKSLLARPEFNGKIKPVAANIDAIIIVNTPPPMLSEHLIDRYLVAAEHLKISSAILLNKTDLLDKKTESETRDRLAIYEKIDYPVMFSSTVTQNGLESLREFLKNKTCVLVGASGVGKSSMIRALTGETDIKIGDVSLKGTGKHTTTTARLYHLPTGGTLIDSPGVREFGLWHLDRQAILEGFKEFTPFLGQCHFSDCSHLKEADCAIEKAITENKISRERWDSYLKIVTEL